MTNEELIKKVEALESRLTYLEQKLVKLANGIEFIKVCHMHPDTRKKLEQILQ